MMLMCHSTRYTEFCYRVSTQHPYNQQHRLPDSVPRWHRLLAVCTSLGHPLSGSIHTTQQAILRIATQNEWSSGRVDSASPQALPAKQCAEEHNMLWSSAHCCHASAVYALNVHATLHALHTTLSLPAQPAARRQAPLCGETSASPSRQGLLRARPRVYSHPQSHIPLRIHPIRLFLLSFSATGAAYPAPQEVRTRGRSTPCNVMNTYWERDRHSTQLGSYAMQDSTLHVMLCGAPQRLHRVRYVCSRVAGRSSAIPEDGYSLWAATSTTSTRHAQIAS